MNNRHNTPHPQGYRLEDAPYGRPTMGSPGPGMHNLEIPMGPGTHRVGTPSDQLAAQPSVGPWFGASAQR